MMIQQKKEQQETRRKKNAGRGVPFAINPSSRNNKDPAQS
jgi:hypothetical protein